VKYSHLFWLLFGIPADRWDDLLLTDIAWMKRAADDYERRQKEAAAHG